MAWDRLKGNGFILGHCLVEHMRRMLCHSLSVVYMYVDFEIFLQMLKSNKYSIALRTYFLTILQPSHNFC